jgi:hypothetical protein
MKPLSPRHRCGGEPSDERPMSVKRCAQMPQGTRAAEVMRWCQRRCEDVRPGNRLSSQARPSSGKGPRPRMRRLYGVDSTSPVAEQALASKAACRPLAGRKVNGLIRQTASTAAVDPDETATLLRVIPRHRPSQQPLTAPSTASEGLLPPGFEVSPICRVPHPPGVGKSGRAS